MGVSECDAMQRNAMQYECDLEWAQDNLESAVDRKAPGLQTSKSMTEFRTQSVADLAGLDAGTAN